MSYIAVFLAATLLDLFYARWVRYTVAHNVLGAVVCSTMIGVCGLTSTLSVVHDKWNAIPYLLGLGVGAGLGAARFQR